MMILKKTQPEDTTIKFHHKKSLVKLSNLDKICYKAFPCLFITVINIQLYRAFLIIKAYIIKKSPFVFFSSHHFFQKKKKSLYILCENIYVKRRSLFYLQQHQCMPLALFTKKMMLSKRQHQTNFFLVMQICICVFFFVWVWVIWANFNYLQHSKTVLSSVKIMWVQVQFLHDFLIDMLCKIFYDF